eukprot:m.515473 g.515473  ORF g.515473 m.515473 type:complete len:201 (+) comp21922_c0_seq18:198-800(+)
MSFLERYLDAVETLPISLHKNLGMIRDLDDTTEERSLKLEKQCKLFLESMPNYSAEERRAELLKIEDNFKETRELAERKVNLAVSTYETVDKYIQELDIELNKFEAEHAVSSTSSETRTKRGRGSGTAGSAKKPRVGLLTAESERIEDMPVDPNEPTYCLCHQVSYGEMIACDNKDVRSTHIAPFCFVTMFIAPICALIV